jgi:hypothetical protein
MALPHYFSSHRIALGYIALHRITARCIAMHLIALHHMAFYRIALACRVVLYLPALHRIA